MMQSLSRHVDTPPVRQTKTSALRLQRVKGNSPWDPREPQNIANSHIPTIRERAESSSVARSKQDRQSGPFRTNSRGRYGVTGRGSPYTIPTRLPAAKHPVARDESNAYQKPPQTVKPFEATELGLSSASTPASGQGRKSSIPVLAQYVHHTHTVSAEDEFVIMPQELPTGPPSPKHAAHDKENASAPSIQGRNENERPSDVDSTEDETGLGIHGHDEYGSYRIRRVTNGTEMGPTLRIEDTADHFIFGGQDQTSDNVLCAWSPNISLKHKGSAPEVNSPRLAKDQTRRSSAIFANSKDFVRQLGGRTLSRCKTTGGDENEHLIDETKSDSGSVVRTELLDSDVHLRIHDSVQDDDVMTNPWNASGSVYTLGPSDDSWPVQDVGPFTLHENDTRVPSAEEFAYTEESLPPLVKREAPPTSPSRPPTIVLKTDPNEETAPFLFQNLEEEKAKEQQLVQDDEITGAAKPAPHIAHHKAKPSVDSVASGRGSPFPPRTTSRKPRPPPVIVTSPTTNSLPSLVPKATAITPSNIKVPLNVKTFSQSKSPGTTPSTTRGRKISAVLSHTPSSASKKKVVEGFKGLFHKKSQESTKGSKWHDAPTVSEEDVLPRIPALVREDGQPRFKSFKRKAAPTFFGMEKGQAEHNDEAKDVVEEKPNEAVKDGDRFLKAFDRAQSPTTPWTANIRTPQPALESSPTLVTANSSVQVSKLCSPEKLTHALPNALAEGSQTSLPATASDTPPVLSHATVWTHKLLDLARAENSPAKKKHLIELSKRMVELVSRGRDAEKAMEKAKMEASRAEVAYLKCLKEVSIVEGLVGRMMAMMEETK
jgi:hypothetical protein